MFNSNKELIQKIYDILIEFKNVTNINQFLSNHNNDPDFETALEECINNRFISGLVLDCAPDGSKMLSIINNPKITLIGLEFLEDFTK